MSAKAVSTTAIRLRLRPFDDLRYDGVAGCCTAADTGPDRSVGGAVYPQNLSLYTMGYFAVFGSCIRQTVAAYYSVPTKNVGQKLFWYTFKNCSQISMMLFVCLFFLSM